MIIILYRFNYDFLKYPYIYNDCVGRNLLIKNFYMTLFDFENI